MADSIPESWKGLEAERAHWQHFVGVHLERGDLDMARGAFNRYALVTGKLLRQARADALREAGRAMRVTPLARDEVESWLFDRADRIAAGGDHRG